MAQRNATIDASQENSRSYELKIQFVDSSPPDRRTDDGVDGPALPVLSSAAVAACVAVHRNGDDGGVDSR